MIKTLKDLNQAGNRFWSRPNRDDAGKRAQDLHPALKHNAPPGQELCPKCGGYGRKYGEICDVCHGKGFIPEGAADSDETPVVGKNVTLRASGGVVLKGKITEVTPTSYTITWEDGRKTTYTRDASEPGSAGKAKDGLPQEIADMLAVQGKMTLEQIQQELERSGWDVTRGQVLVALAAAKAKNSGGVWRPE